ncbi:hypothetical protein [Mycobacterium camsae]|uniref:hypothetical protein n=1 Tax=Mycobacterium gordonae TaxID=1778 RepID=UPI001F119B81|nr:hypothetical protein [Mycobacterium gordonae]
MIVIIGLVVFLAAVIVGLLGVLNNAGPAHPLNESFSVLGYHVTGSTGTLFLFGIVIGALAMLGMSVLLAGAHRTAGRGRDARRELKRSQREVEFVNRDRDFQNRSAAAADSTMDSELDTTRPGRMRGALLGRRSSDREQAAPQAGGGRR